MLVGFWVICAFSLTLSYKSVLRAKMMTIQYEETIDTVDDLLASTLPVAIANDTSLKFQLEKDTSDKMQQLLKRKGKVTWYRQGKSIPDWINEG